MKFYINKQVTKLFSAALLASSLTACDDFLSIVPLNEVVLENYWTEEADVTSVVNSCYAQLESGDCLKRMLVWGELRSDNLTTGAGAPQYRNPLCSTGTRKGSELHGSRDEG